MDKDKHMQSIVITGATGMIGLNIVKLAIDQGYSVLCIIRPGSKKECNLPVHENVKIVYSDISGYNEMKIDGKYDVFIHLAWEKTFGAARDDTDSQLNNIKYTLDAVHLAKRLGCSVFIGAGSQAEYGPVQCKLSGNTPVNPSSGYGIAKYTAGKLSRLLCAQLGLRHNWIRILSVYGKFDNSYTLISYVADCCKKGIVPELTKCEQTWDYINEKDAAAAFVAVSDKGVDGKVYVLGSGEGRSLRSYIEDIVDSMNPTISPMFGKKEYYPNQPMYLVADIDELIRDTGWRPKVDFKEGICIL
jgi:nucleoside-diphosphate-sugar epimerase